MKYYLDLLKDFIHKAFRVKYVVCPSPLPEKLELSQAEMANMMHDLKRYRPFKALQAMWLDERAKILHNIESAPDKEKPEWCHILKGYNMAMMAHKGWDQFHDKEEASRRAKRERAKQPLTPTADLEN